MYVFNGFIQLYPVIIILSLIALVVCAGVFVVAQKKKAKAQMLMAQNLGRLVDAYRTKQERCNEQGCWNK